MRTKKTLHDLAAQFVLPALLILFTASGSQAASFRLIYGNDNLGELDGCG
ncbi:hypothetical protein [Desulfobulbus elongatus]|nr:hypothetical protein [Desulfobulbus elongatus]